MAEIRQRSEQILQVREGLRAKHPGKSLYFPWTPYQDSVRTFQTYLAKFPRDVLAVLPEVRSVVDSLDGESSGPIGRDDVEEMEREIASSAGRPRPKRHGRGQGFAVDTQIKVAVESHAMNAALRYYEELGDVVDTSRKASFDYAVRIDGVTWHVEVKGTTGGAADVLLTRKEVEHAETYPHVALFVLSEIVVMRTTDGTVEVSGGHPILLHPWSLDGSRLTPLAYKYSLSA
jgi:hypothetical protein